MKVFHALGTMSSPFDVVELRSVRQDGLPQSDVLETTPLEGDGLGTLRGPFSAHRYKDIEDRLSQVTLAQRGVITVIPR